MSAPPLPLILEPDALERHLGEEGLLVLDLSQAKTHARFHIPGAVFVDYGRLVRTEHPTTGLLPEPAQLSALFSEVGLTPDVHVVAYDDEGGGRAARLLWTLDVLGHTRHSLLNGGLHAWANEGHPLSSEPTRPRPGQYRAQLDLAPVADRAFVLAHLGNPAVALVDARSPEEYHGTKVLAARAGHIPGAVNLEWTQAMDRTRNLRLKPAETLQATLAELGVTPDKTVVTYCQSHHRSAHTYLVLKSLAFPRVKGYPGSWSDWGNRPDTPVER